MKKIILLFSFFLIGSWFAFSSFLYVDHLVNHPDSISEKYLISMGDPGEYFNAIEDVKRRDEGLSYAKSHGTEREALMMLALGFKFLKPTWKTVGFFKFLIRPIIHPIETFEMIRSALGYNWVQDDFIVNPMVELIFKLLLWLLIFSFSLFILLVFFKFIKDAFIILINRLKAL